MKNLKLLAAVCAGALFFGACSSAQPGTETSSEDISSAQQETESTPSENTEGAKIALLVPDPFSTDGNPFVALVHKGISQAAEEQGAELKVLNNVESDAMESQIREMAKAGYNPIITIWDNPADAAMAVAPDFPETKFIIGDTFKEPTLENVMTVAVEPLESAFIAGYVAAKSSKTGKIGFAGSVDAPNINNYKYGYTAGAKYANPDIIVDATYIGTNEDPVKGKETALQLAADGSDVIMHAADQGGLGVIKGCEEAGVMAIGVDDWQGGVSEAVIWSALKNIAQAMHDATVTTFDGTFKNGLKKYTAIDEIAIYDDRDLESLSEDLQKEVLALTQDIKSGKIDVAALIEA